MEKINELMSTGFMGFLSFGLVYAVNVLSKMKDSIEDLNVHIATLIEQNKFQQKQIEENKDHIEDLYDRING